ncbi:aspartyl protease family protein 1-like [Musa acuminata AAA Group]|uniref:aspartyl protease family protein 1-like n=1 Tax=Musa acuminata AAA Group TaxID=214697 RepID=UPI0031CFDF1C
MPPTCSAPWDCKPSPPPLGLPYAFLKLGTPNVTFLVALDTGSDLFWVACDCHQCAVAKFDNFEFDIYSTSNSSTSQKITCNNSLCDNQNACTAETSSCPNIVQYLSANTSTSGVLVEDVPYLMTEDETPRIVEAPIAGAFLDGPAQSFSMCFGDDGLGRINIGDKGSWDQQEAAFIINKAHTHLSKST